MASKQTAFLNMLRARLEEAYEAQLIWSGGQIVGNKAAFRARSEYRRGGLCRANEGIELGDLRTSIGGWSVIIEHESDGTSVQNLVKYWPYLRGELRTSPLQPIMLLHFSDWRSYGSFRDLWVWIRDRMVEDNGRKVPFVAEQFDHGGESDLVLRQNLDAALAFIDVTIPTLAVVETSLAEKIAVDSN